MPRSEFCTSLKSRWSERMLCGAHGKTHTRTQIHKRQTSSSGTGGSVKLTEPDGAISLHVVSPILVLTCFYFLRPPLCHYCFSHSWGNPYLTKIKDICHYCLYYLFQYDTHIHPHKPACFSTLGFIFKINSGVKNRPRTLFDFNFNVSNFLWLIGVWQECRKNILALAVSELMESLWAYAYVYFFITILSNATQWCEVTFQKLPENPPISFRFLQ